MNILHDINDERIKPEEFVAYIEISKGSNKKYEIDKETGLLMLDRLNTSGAYYPMNYGFIPRTLCEDGDALDVCVLTSVTLDPMTLCVCKPVGLIRMVDTGEKDEKILAVLRDDPNNDMPRNAAHEIEHFFKTYKLDNPKKVVTLEPFEGKDAAIAMIKEAKEYYIKHGGKK